MVWVLHSFLLVVDSCLKEIVKVSSHWMKTNTLDSWHTCSGTAFDSWYAIYCLVVDYYDDNKVVLVIDTLLIMGAEVLVAISDSW